MIRRSPLLIPGLVLGLACAPLWGQGTDYIFQFDLGQRWLAGFQGNSDLYRSQLDYGEGPKLLSGEFFLARPDGGGWFDRVEWRADNWGGEPHSSARFRIAKDRLYDFRLDYQNVRYFNAIPSFANPFFETGLLLSQHRFDLAHRHLRLELELAPGRSWSPFFLYQRSSRRGPVRTTWAADGDEFLVRSDVQTGSDEVRGGIQLNLERFSLRLEQGWQWYRDESLFVARGFQTGNSSRRIFGRDIFLVEYEARNDVKAAVPFSRAVVALRPHRRLQVRGQLSYSLADLDARFVEEMSGNFFAFPEVAAFYLQGGSVSDGGAKRPALVGQVSVDWRWSGRLRLVEKLTLRRWHLNGALALSTVLAGVEPIGGEREENLRLSGRVEDFLALNTTRQELLAVLQLTDRVALRGGHRYESQRLELLPTFQWHRHVLLLGGSLTHPARHRLNADFELGRTQGQFFRTDPVDFYRLRLQGRFSPSSSLQLGGNFGLFHHDNDLSSLDFRSRSRRLGGEFSYQLSSRLLLSGFYERSRFFSSLLVLLPQTREVDRSLFLERVDHGGLGIQLQLPRGSSLQLGYTILDSVGNLPLQSHYPSARLEVGLGAGVSVYTHWNYYSYDERLPFLPQHYQTHLLLAGLRFRLSSDF